MATVSGGYVEDILVERLTKAHSICEFPAVIKFGSESGDLKRFQLSCNGMLQVVIEKITYHKHFQTIVNACPQQSRLVRELDLVSGRVKWFSPQKSLQCF